MSWIALAMHLILHTHRERGDPREMLRAINPREAQLADAASGIHVRFRLGGTMFPPLVFYKIFTHRCTRAVKSCC
jgi:hypothetical protein